MSEKFEALRSDVDTAKNDIIEDNHRPRLSFLEEYYGILDKFLITVLDSLEELCGEDSVRPVEKEDSIKNGAYQELQRVRRIRSAIHSQGTPIELYYLLEDIKKDLSIDSPIGLDPGSEPERKFMIDSLKNRFKVLQKIAFWNVWDEDDIDPKIINIPRSELRRPLSYSLIAHECFHIKDDLIEDIVTKFADADTAIQEEFREEVAIDLLSLNYMGPVYAERLVQIPNKIGEHKSDTYPDFDKRLGYCIRYIDWLHEEKGKTISDLPAQRKLTDDEQTIYNKLEENVYNKLADNRTDDPHVFTRSEFRNIQEYIRELFSEHQIPTYDEERDNLREYLGMPKADVNTLNRKLDDFLLKSAPNSEIALPIKPNLFLNLLLLVNGYNNKDINRVTLLSFKKWYVTSRTREQLK